MRRSSDFDAAVRRGSRAGRSSLVVHVTRVPGSSEILEPGVLEPGILEPAALAPARMGFVVSKAVGSAVVRNRVKRQLRHLARERVGALPAGTLAVVRANPAAAGRTSTELAEDLDGALRSALRKAGR